MLVVMVCSPMYLKERSEVVEGHIWFIILVALLEKERKRRRGSWKRGSWEEGGERKEETT